MEATAEKPTTTKPRTKLVHLAIFRPGCPPPAKALCGARVTLGPVDVDRPDCVVCASMLAGIERGCGE